MIPTKASSCEKALLSARVLLIQNFLCLPGGEAAAVAQVAVLQRSYFKPMSVAVSYDRWRYDFTCSM